MIGHIFCRQLLLQLKKEGSDGEETSGRISLEIRFWQGSVLLHLQ
jgi:hypothetical protein